MSHTFVAMVTFHISQIALSSPLWVVYISPPFSPQQCNEHSQVFFPTYFCTLQSGFHLVWFFFLSAVFDVELTRLDSRCQQTEPANRKERSLNASGLNKVTYPPGFCRRRFPNNAYISHLMRTWVYHNPKYRSCHWTQTVSCGNALLQSLYQKKKKKRKCYLPSCHILSVVLVFLFDPQMSFFFDSYLHLGLLISQISLVSLFRS